MELNYKLETQDFKTAKVGKDKPLISAIQNKSYTQIESPFPHAEAVK